MMKLYSQRGKIIVYNEVDQLKMLCDMVMLLKAFVCVSHVPARHIDLLTTLEIIEASYHISKLNFAVGYRKTYLT